MSEGIHYCDSCAGECEITQALSIATARAKPRLEDAARWLREIANEKEVPEHWRNACALWATIINGTLERIAADLMASSATDCVANSPETAGERALPKP
jgi:hypothetical protein